MTTYGDLNKLSKSELYHLANRDNSDCVTIMAREILIRKSRVESYGEEYVRRVEACPPEWR